MNHYHKTTTAGFFALGGPVLGVGGAQDEQGPNAAGVLVILSKHILHTFSFVLVSALL